VQDLEYEIADDSHYLFAAGELSAKEEQFIEDSKLKRMVSAYNIKELLKLIRETHYAQYTDRLEEGDNFDSVVTTEFGQMANYLSSRLKASHRPVIHILFAPEEIHNYKLLGKALAKNDNLEQLYTPLLYSYNDMLAAAKGTRFAYMDPLSQQTAFRAAELFGREGSFREKEFALEAHYLESLWDAAKQISVPLIIDFLRVLMDLYNIKSIYRHWLAQEKMDIEKIIAGHGFLDKSYYKHIKKEGAGDFFKALEKTRYRHLVYKGSEPITEHKDFSITEKNEDIFAKLFFRPARYTSYNLEKVFDFFLKKKIEIKTLNIIYNGILYGMDKDRLRHEVMIFDEDKDRSHR